MGSVGVKSYKGRGASNGGKWNKSDGTRTVRGLLVFLARENGFVGVIGDGEAMVDVANGAEQLGAGAPNVTLKLAWLPK